MGFLSKSKLFKRASTGSENTVSEVGPQPSAQTPTTSSTPPYASSHISKDTQRSLDIRYEIQASYLLKQQSMALWLGNLSGINEGILLRKSRSDYLAYPEPLINSSLARAAAAMNLNVVMTVNSRVIKAFLAYTLQATSVPLRNGLRIQIIQSMENLAKARKNQGMALVSSVGLLVLWDDDSAGIVRRAREIESELVQIVWQSGLADGEKSDEPMDEKKTARVEVKEMDEETGQPVPESRPINLQNTILVCFTLFIVVAFLGAGWRKLVIEVAVDHNYTRLALVLLTPVQVFFTLFFAQVCVGCIAQCFGPIKQMNENSRYYSAKLPVRLTSDELPHVTIQCPVYKEGLSAVIAPTVRSLKTAIATYELQGGSANIVINDDGIQLLDEAERQARLEFYADNSIGWTARPGHNVDGYIRRGKFKKASNMNFGLMLANNVEEKLASFNRDSAEGWTQDDEAVAYNQCLNDVLNEHGRAWADGDIRIGDYILLIDSDTRVPSDCLLDAVSEMEQSPEVGIMQFSSGVMQVVNDFFENGITFFTNLIYTSIRYTVSNGDVAPFVGHNAILRWSAIQEIGYVDEDGYEKFWSEHHVSEDFEMSLKLQCAGFIIRLASWAGEGFKEGVSLTVYDELARWEKYAYGCNELLFHPIRTWLWRGPFTPLFRRFLFSNIRITSKITILSYIGTYYAIAAAWILTLVNYLAIGLFNGHLDQYYIDSWKVWFSIVIVFNGLGNLALATMRYRIGERSWIGSLVENFKWSFMLAIFLGGLSLHVSQAILAHMFEINMTWVSLS